MIIYYEIHEEKYKGKVVHVADCITHEEAIERHEKGLPVWDGEGKELTEKEIISGEREE